MRKLTFSEAISLHACLTFVQDDNRFDMPGFIEVCHDDVALWYKITAGRYEIDTIKVGGIAYNDLREMCENHINDLVDM